MKNVTDNKWKRTVADSIGLDEKKQRSILDDVRKVSDNEHAIKISATNRDTFDQIINHVLWPGEDLSSSASGSIRARLEDDPEHTETGASWPQRSSSTLVLNDVAPTGRPLRTSDMAYDTSYHFISEVPPAPKPETHPGQSAEKQLSRIAAAEEKAKPVDGRDALLPAVEKSAASDKKASATAPGSRKGAGYPKKNSDEMLQTVLTSVPPPYKSATSRYQKLIVALSAAAVLVAGVTVYLIVAQMNRNVEPVANVVSAVMVQPLASEPGTIVQPISGKVISKQDAVPVEAVELKKTGDAPSAKPTVASIENQGASVLPGQVKVSALDGASSGGPAVEEVEAALLAVVPSSVKNCDVPTSGDPSVRLVVDGNGKVITASAVGNSFANTAAGKCAMETIRKSTFPSSELGSYMIQYSF